MAKVIVRGISFNTKKEACTHFGVNSDTVKHRVRLLGIDFEDAIFLEKQDNSSDEAIKSHILSNVKVDAETGCWNWQLSCFAFGYGQRKANILRIIRGDRFNSVFQRFKKEYLDVQEG